MQEPAQVSAHPLLVQNPGGFLGPSTSTCMFPLPHAKSEPPTTPQLHLCRIVLTAKATSLQALAAEPEPTAIPLTNPLSGT
jgi:hypothetical protein